MITLHLPLAVEIIMGKTPMELFKAGGPVMWPVLLVSFLSLTVVVERLIFIVRENASRDHEMVEKMLEKVENRDVDGAVALGQKSKDFVARVLVYALSNKDTSLSNAFIRASNQELARFQQGLATLDTVITAAPLLGLLGTVTGMMGTFGSLGTGGDIASKAGQHHRWRRRGPDRHGLRSRDRGHAAVPLQLSQRPPRGGPPRDRGRLQRARADHQEVRARRAPARRVKHPAPPAPRLNNQPTPLTHAW